MDGSHEVMPIRCEGTSTNLDNKRIKLHKYHRDKTVATDASQKCRIGTG